MLSDRAAKDAALRLARGELVAFPTETVWGLAADSHSQAAVGRLCAWKRRGDQPISLLIDAPEQLTRLPLLVTERARLLAAEFWPGPLTLVLPALAGAAGAPPLASGIASDEGAVGVRCSPHPLARALAAAAREAGCGFPTATSCNRAGEPAAEDVEQARSVCADVDPGEIGPVVLEPGPNEDAWGAGVASSVIDLCGRTPRLLREGQIARVALERVLHTDVE